MAVMDSRSDCALCGAVGVPVSWSWRLYAHRAGKDYVSSRVDSKPGKRCQGESAADNFQRMLRNAALMMSAKGMRYTTDSETEAACRKRRAEQAGGTVGAQGELFSSE